MWLALESTCDELALAYGDGENLLYETIYSQAQEHTNYGGVFPELASRLHQERIDISMQQLMLTPQWQPDALTHLYVASGPGLLGSLLVGCHYMAGYALGRQLPLFGIDHIEAHLFSPCIEQNVSFPFLGLVLSGGHTLLVRVDAPWQRHIIGKTRDDALGEMFDKIGGMLGYQYPAGADIEQAAQQARRQHHFSLPAPGAHLGCDFSYSGLKSAVRRIVTATTLSQEQRCDLCALIQQKVQQDLEKKVTKALELHPDITCLVVGGGVAANRSILDHLHKTIARPVYGAQKRYCGDNAAMIGLLGNYLTCHSPDKLRPWHPYCKFQY